MNRISRANSQTVKKKIDIASAPTRIVLFSFIIKLNDTCLKLAESTRIKKKPSINAVVDGNVSKLINHFCFPSILVVKDVQK